jgi:hypothetical protein
MRPVVFHYFGTERGVHLYNTAYNTAKIFDKNKGRKLTEFERNRDLKAAMIALNIPSLMK